MANEDDDDSHSNFWLLVELQDGLISVRTQRGGYRELLYYQEVAVSNAQPCVLLEHLSQQDQAQFTIDFDENILNDDLSITEEERQAYFAKKRRESRVITVLKSMYSSLVWDMGGDTGDNDDGEGGYQPPTLTFTNENDLVLFKLYW